MLRDNNHWTRKGAHALFAHVHVLGRSSNVQAIAPCQVAGQWSLGESPLGVAILS